VETVVYTARRWGRGQQAAMAVKAEPGSVLIVATHRQKAWYMKEYNLMDKQVISLDDLRDELFRR
jgi:hypothetical protein